ncbi:hypothetical protein J6590_064799, partial [Homalodisca vitripennis]
NSNFNWDFIVDTLKVALTSPAGRYLDILNDAGFVACIDKITRPRSKTCLDHCFVKSNKSFDVTSFVLQKSVTDHYPIVMEITPPRLVSKDKSQESHKSLPGGSEELGHDNKQ